MATPRKAVTPAEATAETQREVVAEVEAERDAAVITAEDHRNAIEFDYGQWVAVANIPHGTALAFAVGHQVPDTLVQKYGYDKQGLVKRVGK